MSLLWSTNIPSPCRVALFSKLAGSCDWTVSTRRAKARYAAGLVRQRTEE